jgi:replicative DNA helicase
MPDSVENLPRAPNSLEAEQAVLGGLLLRNTALDEIDDRVSVQDFYTEAHRSTFAIIRDLIVRGKQADVVTVGAALETAGELEAAGGATYLVALLNGVPTSANIVHYADIVRDRSVRRRLIGLSHDLQHMALARDGRSAAELVDTVQRMVSEIVDVNLTDEPVELSTLLPQVVDDVEKRSRGEEVPGLKTGIGDLDMRLGGLIPGELYIVAGEPSSGKTTLAMQFAFTTACGQPGAPVYVNSLEMKAKALAERGIASIGRVNRNAMRNGRLDTEDWSRMSHGLQRLTDAKPVFIDYSLTVERMRARAKRIQRRRGLGLIVVDYIGLMQGAGETQNERVGSITRGLKTLAMELDVPVVALSQLNRARAQRTNKRPVMTDLRDSGNVEADADVIMFVYREELHSDDEDLKGKAEIIVGKLREGEPGTTYAAFVGQFNRFDNTEWRPSQSSSVARRSDRHRADLDG